MGERERGRIVGLGRRKSRKLNAELSANLVSERDIERDVGWRGRERERERKIFSVPCPTTNEGLPVE